MYQNKLTMYLSPQSHQINGLHDSPGPTRGNQNQNQNEGHAGMALHSNPNSVSVLVGPPPSNHLSSPYGLGEEYGAADCRDCIQSGAAADDSQNRKRKVAESPKSANGM